MGQREKKETYLSQLPGGLHLGRVVAHARLHGGLGQVWGETHLLVHDEQLIVMTRKSVLDTYEILRFHRSSEPRLEESDFRTRLVLRDLQREIEIPVKKDERLAVDRVLQALRTGAPDGSWPPGPEAFRPLATAGEVSAEAEGASSAGGAGGAGGPEIEAVRRPQAPEQDGRGFFARLFGRKKGPV